MVMEDRPLRAVLLGDAQTVEMKPIARMLQEAVSIDDLCFVSDIPAADAAAQQTAWFPDLIVACQNRSDEFSRTDVDRLLSLFPLARWVCCFGAWCESDGRNRDIWPTAIRVPARCAWSRIQRELAVIRGKASPLPLTASRDEAFEFDSPGDVVPADTPCTVCVASPDAELRLWVADLLRTAGYEVVVQFDQSVVDVLVMDVDPWNGRAAAELRDLCRRNSQLAVVALMTFAHPEDVQAIIACGADRVIAKLTSHTELLDAVATVCRAEKKPAA